MVKKYQIVCYVRVDAEEPELYDSKEEAEHDALNHFSVLQPENKYIVEEVDVEDEIKNSKKNNRICTKCKNKLSNTIIINTNALNLSLYNEWLKNEKGLCLKCFISDKKENEKIMCKCGHWIGIIGTKWQHLEKVNVGTVYETTRYGETCHECDCINPEPVELNKNIVSDDVYNAM